VAHVRVVAHLQFSLEPMAVELVMLLAKEHHSVFLVPHALGQLELGTLIADAFDSNEVHRRPLCCGGWVKRSRRPPV